MGLEEAVAMQGLITLALFGLFLLFIISVLNGSKTRQYRKNLADMYVAGKIKQLATKEQIDITKELKEFVRFTKQQKKFMQDLDDSIETDLHIKVQDEAIEYKDLK